MTTLFAAPHVQCLSHERKRRQAPKAQTVSPHVRGVTLSKESLVDFVMPAIDDPWQSSPNTGGNAPVRRDYTPRRFETTSCDSVRLASSPIAAAVVCRRTWRLAAA